MIVCLAKDNLIGDKNPIGNGLLWHSAEELKYYKSKTVGNIVLFGKNTASYVPINLLKKTREVIILEREMKIKEIKEKYKDTHKDIFICGGYTIYKYYLENETIDKIYISKLKPHIEILEAKNPLYFPNVEDYGYKLVENIEYQDFIASTYEKISK